MEEERAKIKIGFTYTDEFGNEYNASSYLDTFSEFENELTVIGRQFNAFLSQIGYIRHHTEMLMESLTEKEVEMLTDLLGDLRSEEETDSNRS